MITTYLQGGLGNQMFQIATTCSHAKKHNDIAVFDLNNSHTPLQGNNVSKYKDKLFNGLTHMDNIYTQCNKVFTQPVFSYTDIPYETNQQLQGFFQSEKFFLENKESIINMFRDGLITNYNYEWVKISDELIGLRDKFNKPIVSIHIRRGDYLKHPNIHTPHTLKYYNNAIEIMKEKIGDFHAYFVSDDIEWCKETFENYNSFSNYTDDVEDLILMVNCDHNIITNSSFSWWGAYLNSNDNKVVIGPNKWFGPSSDADQSDIIPTNWIKI